MISEEQVILVDENDNETGTMGKMEAHEKGLLHRAFSIFIFNQSGKLLLQQRALSKYHSPGLWTNTCCSHPRINESNEDAAKRRLHEEMGFVCDLRYAFNFTYKASFDNHLIEHEFDHVFFGEYEGAININRDEVMNYQYLSLDQIGVLLRNSPELFTPWFKICFEEVLANRAFKGQV